MMTVHKIGGCDAAGYSAYLASREDMSQRGDYYLSPAGDHVEGIGQWHGRAAAELGLVGEVTREQLLAVWEGKDPRSGEILIRRSARGEHVAAVDCTFSAPKSVSVVWALASPEHRAELEAAQGRAVAVAVSHIEGHAPLVRRRINGEVRHEPAAGLAVARFRHHTSRSCAAQHEKGQAPDPQLHDHCAIANLALRHHDALAAGGGRWAAVDSRELYRIAAEAGAVYRAELAAELLQLGYRVHREGRYFEISGVSVQARRSFSQRAQEVEAATARFVAKHGRRPTDEEARNLVVLSRHPKATEHAAAFAQWQERAQDVGLTPADVDRLRREDAGRELLPFDGAAERITVDLVDPASPHALTRSAAVFDARTLRIAVAEAAQGRARGTDVAALISAVAASPDIVRLDAVHATTQRMLDSERAVLLAARVKALSTQGLSARRGAVSAAIEGARVTLSAEQQAAVRALTDDRALALLPAPAGAGKGEVLRAVAAAYRQEGRRVIALAAAGETAQRLGSEIGADEARTVDSFLYWVADGERPPDMSGAVVVLDEAGLLETQRWHRLLPATVGAKLIAAGDGAQLSPIEAGGLWSVLEERLGAATLSENYRAQEQWASDAWTALREGQSLDALHAFEEHQQIVIAEDRQAARAAAVARWDEERQGREGQLDRVLLLTDSSNAEVDALNAAAQQRRLAAAELTPEYITVTTEYRDSLVAREEQLHGGDVVTFERRLYPAEQQRDDRGDIRSVRRVENGEAGVITAVDAERECVTVQLRDRSITVAAEQLDALRLGYAQHVYSAQGRTVDAVVVVLGGWQTDRESSYVGLSRARERTVVVTDLSSLGVAPGDRDAALQELGERVATSRPQVAALALVDRVRDGQADHSLTDRHPDHSLTDDPNRKREPRHGVDAGKEPLRYGPGDQREPADRIRELAQRREQELEANRWLQPSRGLDEHHHHRSHGHERGPSLGP